MEQVFRSHDVPYSMRLDCWRHKVNSNIVPLDLHIDHGPEFPSQLRTGELGALRVAEVRTGPARVLRTPKLIRQSDPEFYRISLVTGGEVLLEQDGRQCRLRPGEFAFLDYSRPSLCVQSANQVVITMFPKALLPLPHDKTAQLTATRIPGNEGTGALISDLARRLPRHLDEVSAASGARVGTALIDMLSVTLAGRLGGTVPPETRERSLIVRIGAFIEEHLASPELSPATIAAAHHVSVRYVHKLFQEEGTSAAALIRERRLDRCRRDLLDPALRDRPAAAIGARWGFRNAAHFSRLFSRVHGLPPGEFRELS